MIEIGDWIVLPSVYFWLGLVGILGSVTATIIGRSASRLRVAGTRMAVQQAEIDFPGERVLGAMIIEKKPHKIVRVDLAGGRQVRYQIAVEEELAIRIDY